LRSVQAIKRRQLVVNRIKDRPEHRRRACIAEVTPLSFAEVEIFNDE
jgi:hypothetical protein